MIGFLQRRISVPLRSGRGSKRSIASYPGGMAIGGGGIPMRCAPILPWAISKRGERRNSEVFFGPPRRNGKKRPKKDLKNHRRKAANQEQEKGAIAKRLQK